MARTNTSVINRLARQLTNSPELRAEVATIAGRVGQGPKPSDEYIEWKHELNALADKMEVDRSTMTIRVCERAVEVGAGPEILTRTQKQIARKLRAQRKRVS